MTAVTLTQIIRFCASGVLDTPTVDPATGEHQIAAYRETPDLILCPRCECVQEDEARCQNCGRHTGEDET